MASKESFYQFVIKYKSGAEFLYAYELNRSEEEAVELAALIDALVPSIRFNGKSIYPRRVNEYRIYLTETPFPHRSQYLHDLYPDGYTGDFEGKEVTLEISLKARHKFSLDSLLKKENDVIRRIRTSHNLILKKIIEELDRKGLENRINPIIVTSSGRIAEPDIFFKSNDKNFVIEIKIVPKDVSWEYISQFSDLIKIINESISPPVKGILILIGGVPSEKLKNYAKNQDIEVIFLGYLEEHEIQEIADTIFRRLSIE